MAERCNVAVLGASGAVGETMLQTLAQRDFPVAELYALASERSAGRKVAFGEREITVQDAADFDFSRAQIALFSAGGAVSEQYAPRAVAAGCKVIDNTSRFRYEEDIPLVVPEVNAERIADSDRRGIIANPNCSTIQMTVALAPIHRAAGLRRINVATYQAVAGSGRKGMEELEKQSRALLRGEAARPEVYPVQIAFNTLPQIDRFEDNGYTYEEMKMVWETQKIFADPEILVNPTCVRVPVFCGHSEAVNIETREKITADQARELLREAPGVTLMDERKDGGYPTPALQGSGEDGVYVGRLREDISHPRGLTMWVVSDNLRKGAALNSVQIAEALLRDS